MGFVSETHTVLETSLKSLSSVGRALAQVAPPCPEFYPQHHINQMYARDTSTGELQSGESQVEGHPWLLTKLEASLNHKRPGLKHKKTSCL